MSQSVNTNLPPDFPDTEISSGVGPGWFPLVNALHKILLVIDPNYSVAQVKEKFGGLRYYFGASEDGDYKQMQAIVDVAEAMSTYICEKCGAIGKLRIGNFWHKTLCDTCNPDSDKLNKTYKS